MTIKEALQNKKPLIASHRGKSGANIIENTIPAAKCAIMSGADIVEFDVARTLDNKTVVFHTNMEIHLFKDFFPVGLCPLKLLKKRQMHSAYGGKSGYTLDTLEEYLSALKDKSILCLDRIWKADIEKTLETIEKLGMFDQIIIKAGANHYGEKVVKAISRYKGAFLAAICKKKEDLDKIEVWCKTCGITLSAVEVVFKEENDYLCSDEFFERIKKNNQISWANSIDMNGRTDKCAGHGDNVSICEAPGNGWGWLIKKGYDIIQTDWPDLLKKYINSREM